MTPDTFAQIMSITEMNQKETAYTLGVSSPMVHNYLMGTTPIPKDIEDMMNMLLEESGNTIA